MATAPEPPAPGAFEFSPEHDRLFADLAARMRFVGLFLLILGGLSLGVMIYWWTRGTIYVDASSLVLLFLGFWTMSAARSFDAVSATRGRDVPLLMQALGDLRSMYALIQWILILGLALVVLGFVFVRVARG